MNQEHYLNVHCSRSIFRHVPGAFCILHKLLEHIRYMLLDLEYYPRLFMLREQLLWSIISGQNLTEAVASANTALSRDFGFLFLTLTITVGFFFILVSSLKVFGHSIHSER